MADRKERQPLFQFSLGTFIQGVFVVSVMMALFAGVMRQSTRPDSTAFLIYLALLFGFPVAWVVGTGMLGALRESLARRRRDD